MSHHFRAAGGGLGECPVTGELISIAAGPFGQYVKAEKDGVKTRSAPLAKLQPEDVTLDVALDLLSYPKPLGQHPKSKDLVELRRASGTGSIRVGHGDQCAYIPKVLHTPPPPPLSPSPSGSGSIRIGHDI